MDFDERLGWMLLGCGIGFILGYIVRSLRYMKGELDEVDGLVKRKLGDRETDDGFMNMRYIRDVAVLIVVVLTVWAAFASQKASNDVKAQQDRIDQITVCNSEFLSRTIRVLNIRTDAVQARADANYELQKAQAKFFKLLLEIPPLPETDQRQAAEEYVEALNTFVRVSKQTKAQGAATPYPTNEELQACLNR